MQAIRSVVSTEFSAVNELINSQLHSSVPLVEDVGAHIVQAGGKRIRPLLVLLSSGAMGPVSDAQLKLAAIIEFIHTATLLHDDVVDLSELRRGLPTANAKWGNAPSVLVGDFLYTRAFQLMVSLNSMPLMDLLASTTNQIAEGEVLQLELAGNPDTTEAEYDRVITAKTAVLFAAACGGAALLSGETAQRENLYQFGLELGMAFQIADDILDYDGDPEETGKSVGDDLMEGKPTLPLIHALAHASEPEQALLRECLQQRSAERLEAVCRVLHATDSLAYCRRRAEHLADSARQRLQALPEGDHRGALEALCDLAVGRRN